MDAKDDLVPKEVSRLPKHPPPSEMQLRGSSRF